MSITKKRIAAGLAPHDVILTRRGNVVEACHVQRTANAVSISKSRFVVLKGGNAS